MAKILIIEDDPYVQRMYKRIFSFKAYDVEIASGANQGIMLAKQTHPDLILLDIMLPDINGLEVLKILKADPVTQYIPVLMLTNLGDESTMEQATALGADCYMVKADFSPDQVIQELEKHLKN